MNISQILGLQDFNAPNLDKAILVKSKQHGEARIKDSSPKSKWHYRPRSTQITQNGNGCSIKRVVRF